MKRIILGLTALIVGLLFYRALTTPTSSTSQPLFPDSTPIPTSGLYVQKTLPPSFVFVPYWTLGSSISSDPNTALLYFGITADENGINKHDDGYTKLQDFLPATPTQSQKMLVVRLIDSDTNSKILENTNLQQKIASEAIQIANSNNFSGIVLDFELPALSFEKVTNQITNFYKTFYTESQKARMPMYVTLYGDTYVRARPFDVRAISNNSDGIMVMSYDFSKSRGNPGPNFPFGGVNTYGYDFQKMISDFTNDVPKNKLGVVLGMFGYDWPIDSKGDSTGNGVPLSFLEIKQKFLDNCGFNGCSFKRDIDSGELVITYTDEDDKKHEVWLEDPVSAKQKQDFLKKKGINSIGFWAYSYY